MSGVHVKNGKMGNLLTFVWTATFEKENQNGYICRVLLLTSIEFNYEIAILEIPQLWLVWNTKTV